VRNTHICVINLGQIRHECRKCIIITFGIPRKQMNFGISNWKLLGVTPCNLVVMRPEPLAYLDLN
jgi:hypothetical protein